MKYDMLFKLPAKWILILVALGLGIFGIKMSKELGIKVATAVEVGKVL